MGVITLLKRACPGARQLAVRAVVVDELFKIGQLGHAPLDLALGGAQHHEQDGVDGEPGVPEGGVGVLIDLPIERRRWESLVNALIFVIDAFMLLLTNWIAQAWTLGSVWTNSSRRFSGIISVVSFVLRRVAVNRTP